MRVVPLPGYAQDEFDNWVEGEEEDSSDMAVTVFARYPGLSPQVYDEVVGTLDLDANPPIGAILHVVGESEEALQVAEIWRTEQAFQAFNDRFVSALQMRGYLSRPTIEITPAAQPVRGRDGHDRAHGRGLAARHVRGCRALEERGTVIARHRRYLDGGSDPVSTPCYG